MPYDCVGPLSVCAQPGVFVVELNIIAMFCIMILLTKSSS